MRVAGIPLGVGQQQQLNYTIFMPFSSSLTQNLNQHNFDIQGSPTLVDNALYTGTSGMNGVANASDGLLAFGTNDFEISLECKLTSFDNALIDCFASTGSGGDITRGFQLYVYADGRLSFYRLNSPNLEVITDSPVLTINTWNKIKVTRVNSQLSIIVDDVIVKTAIVNDDFQQQFCVIGYQYIDNGNGNYPTRGYIRNVYARYL